jgi:hypothetical protein
MPASKIPRMNRTADIVWMLWTNAVPILEMPKHSEMIGMNHPGPIHLQAMLEGICEARQHSLYIQRIDCGIPRR